MQTTLSFLNQPDMQREPVTKICHTTVNGRGACLEMQGEFSDAEILNGLSMLQRQLSALPEEEEPETEMKEEELPPPPSPSTPQKVDGAQSRSRTQALPQALQPAKGRQGSNVEPELVQKILDLHNAARREAGVPPLSWNDNIARFAHQHANNPQIAGLRHRSRQELGSMGENLAYSWSSSSLPPEKVIKQGIKGWYDEKNNWTACGEPFRTANTKLVRWQQGNASGLRQVPDPQGEKVWGHYTQMIWPSTTEVGCGIGPDPQREGAWRLVCNYSPGGNMLGQDVLPKERCPSALAQPR